MQFRAVYIRQLYFTMLRCLHIPLCAKYIYESASQYSWCKCQAFCFCIQIYYIRRLRAATNRMAYAYRTPLRAIYSQKFVVFVLPTGKFPHTAAYADRRNIARVHSLAYTRTLDEHIFGNKFTKI